MSAEKIGQQGMQTKIQKLNKTRFRAAYTKSNAPMILKIATPYSSSLAETGALMSLCLPILAESLTRLPEQALPIRVDRLKILHWRCYPHWFRGHLDSKT
jgi:hypothetical protein